MMKKLLDGVIVLTAKELALASKDHGDRFHSLHEGYGVIREELDEAKGAISKLGLKLESIHHFPVDGADHAVIVLRKVKPTPAQYPRRYAKIKQFPL